MVWGVAWLSRPPVALASSRLLRLLRLRLLSMEVMLEEEAVRERARRVIPADGTAKQSRGRQRSLAAAAAVWEVRPPRLLVHRHAKRLSSTER